jgi:hypothetical protein
MIEIKDFSTDDKICKIFQCHKDDDDFVDSYLISFKHQDLEIFTRLFSSVALAEIRCQELLAATSIDDDLLAGDL